MSEVTQELIDKGIDQAREQWQKMLDESGMSQAMFITTNKEATQFLGEYEMMRESLIKDGWIVPVLVDGLIVALSDSKPSI
jgi:hypothetical protein